MYNLQGLAGMNPPCPPPHYKHSSPPPHTPPLLPAASASQEWRQEARDPTGYEKAENISPVVVHRHPSQNTY